MSIPSLPAASARRREEPNTIPVLEPGAEGVLRVAAAERLVATDDSPDAAEEAGKKSTPHAPFAGCREISSGVGAPGHRDELTACARAPGPRGDETAPCGPAGMIRRASPGSGGKSRTARWWSRLRG